MSYFFITLIIKVFFMIDLHKNIFCLGGTNESHNFRRACHAQLIILEQIIDLRWLTIRN